MIMLTKKTISNYVSSFLLLKDGRLAVIAGYFIYIYNSKNLNCELIIKEKTRIKLIIQLQNEKLISLSNYINIYIINENKYYCEYTYYLENNLHITFLTSISNDEFVTYADKFFTFWHYRDQYITKKKYEIIIRVDTLFRVQSCNIIFVSNKNLYLSFYYDLDKHKESKDIPLYCRSANNICELKNKRLCALMERRYSLSFPFEIDIINLNNMIIESSIIWPMMMWDNFYYIIKIEDNGFLYNTEKGLYFINPFGSNKFSLKINFIKGKIIKTLNNEII